jgi:pilus assembly protein Flp/PilA
MPVKRPRFNITRGISMKGLLHERSFGGVRKGRIRATAIEYGLIAAGVSIAIITVVNRLGSQLKATFTGISSQLATAGK